MTALLVIGAIRTPDPGRPVASAPAVAGSRIVAIGDLASVRRELPSRTPIPEVPTSPRVSWTATCTCSGPGAGRWRLGRPRAADVRAAREVAARTRMVRELPSPLGPEQAVTATEALDLFATGTAAVAGFGDGRLRVGGPADLTGLGTDPLTPDPDALLTGRVRATVVDGNVEYTV